MFGEWMEENEKIIEEGGQTMTKEQKEAIEKLNRLKNIKLGPENRMGMIIEDFKSLQYGLELILNMLKEKDKEIELLKENINYQTLCDFLISSTSDEVEPLWTEKHIEELLENFEVRWKDAYKQDS